MWAVNGLASGVFMGLAAVVMSTATALAGTFDIKGPEVSGQEHELAFGAAWQKGFPVDADPVRQGYEIGYSYGFTDRFKAGLKIGGDQPVGGDFDATAFGVEAQLAFIQGEQAPISLAWFTGVDVGLRSEEGEVVTFGPLIGFKTGPVDITLNPLFQKSWNPDAPGIDFAYAWQARTDVADGFGLGLEGYGTVTEIGNAPPADFQEHRLGPVVYLETGHASGITSELQFGVLFGLTDATPDTTGRAKFAILW